MAGRIWAGLDVGVETTAICVINDVGEVLSEATCRTALQDVHAELKWLRRRRRATIALEAGLGANLARGLRSFGYSVDLYETRQLSRFLRARRNKTDAGDASGIAEAGRIGAALVSRIHLKSLECQWLQSLLTIRSHLVRQRVRAANLLCRQIELFGGRISGSKRGEQFRQNVEAEIKKLFRKTPPSLNLALHYLLDQTEQLESYGRTFDREVTRLAREIEPCRRFMEIPGVGPVCALAFYAAVGEPHRFSRSADIGTYFGLTPLVRQSGLTTRSGRISKMGNKVTRGLLVHAALSLMRCGSPTCALRIWASGVEQRRGRGRARVALARKLAVIMVAMWKSGERYKENELHPPAALSCVTEAETDPEATGPMDSAAYRAWAGSA